MPKIVGQAFPNLAMSLALVLAITAAPAAQAPGSPQSPQVPPRTPEVVPPPPAEPTSRPRIDLPDVGRRGTDDTALSRVTGCLVAAKASAQTSSSRVDRFLLTFAQVEAVPSDPASTDKSAVADVDAPRPTYRVKGLAPERLRPFLNQRVVIRGTLEREGGGARPTPTSPTPEAATRDEEAWPELDATSISELSGTCAVPR